jgi:hypothetical protein
MLPNWDNISLTDNLGYLKASVENGQEREDLSATVRGDGCFK